VERVVLTRLIACCSPLLLCSCLSYASYQYAELSALHTKYADKGLVILAMPCNQFGAQESGSPEQICAFAKDKGAEFTLTEKVNVNGPATHPVWAYLKTQKPGDVTWNFAAKFIIDKAGNVAERSKDSAASCEPTIAKLLAA